LWPIFQRIIEFLLKIVTMLSKVRYAFGIRDPEKTYSGSRIQGSKRHRIPDPDPQHCRIQCFIDLKKKCGSRQTNITESVANSTCVADPEPVSALAPACSKFGYRSGFGSVFESGFGFESNPNRYPPQNIRKTNLFLFPTIYFILTKALPK